MLRRCKKCGLPETYETIEFDSQGICNICRGAEHKQQAINWDERKLLLDQLVEKYRGKADYDCIVPFSGGKDSTFQLYYLMKEYKLKPLVVRFNHGFMRQVVEENNQRTFKKLGVDVLEFTPNWKIVKRLMLESFKRKTDFCWHCHTGIYSYPLRVALMYKVARVLGSPSRRSRRTTTTSTMRSSTRTIRNSTCCARWNHTAEDMHGMIDRPDDPVDKRDLIPYTYPDVKELKALRYCSVPLGSFIPWDYTKIPNLSSVSSVGRSMRSRVPREINDHGRRSSASCRERATTSSSSSAAMHAWRRSMPSMSVPGACRRKKPSA